MLLFQSGNVALRIVSTKFLSSKFQPIIVSIVSVWNELFEKDVEGSRILFWRKSLFEETRPLEWTKGERKEWRTVEKVLLRSGESHAKVEGQFPRV